MARTAVAIKPSIYPCLSYRDARVAIEWLCTAFGFEKLMIVKGEHGEIHHSELGFGAGVIMVGNANAERGWQSPCDLPAVNQILYVVVDDIDAHYARAKAAGAEIVQEPFDTDYGSRDYVARDPEGHQWYFGTYAPDLNARAHA